MIYKNTDCLRKNRSYALKIYLQELLLQICLFISRHMISVCFILSFSLKISRWLVFELGLDFYSSIVNRKPMEFHKPLFGALWI